MAQKIYKKTINFPKIDGNGNGRKECAASVDVEYRLEVKYINGTPSLYWEFSACGDVWNSRHTLILCGGQCLDDMKKHLIQNDEFRAVYRLWKKYHLNGLRAGTPAQESALKPYFAECKKNNKRCDYTSACAYLQERGLLDDEGYIYNGKPYHYGEAWLVEEIPECDKVIIRDLLGITRADEENAENEARANLDA